VEQKIQLKPPSLEPIDGCAVDVKGVGDFPDGFSLVDWPVRQFCLLGVEVSRAPEVNSPPPGRLTASTSAFPNQLAFKLADPPNTVIISLPA
jgi:hypothetical protein